MCPYLLKRTILFTRYIHSLQKMISSSINLYKLSLDENITHPYNTLYIPQICLMHCLRPYHVENTGSRPITEVKQRRAWLVLRWVTAWEHHVL